MSTTFVDILLFYGKARKRGELSLSGSTAEDAAFLYRTAKTMDNPTRLALNECAFITWCEAGKQLGESSYAIKIGMGPKVLIRFSGFSASAFNPLQSWLLGAGKELVVEKISTRGANWGQLKVSDQRLAFVDKEGLLIFDLPVGNINQSVFQGKQDIAIEFPADDDPKSLLAQGETLTELRLFVPPMEEGEKAAAAAAAAAAAGDVAMKTEEGEEKKEGEGEEGEEGEEPAEEETAAQLLVKDIMSRVGVDDKSVQPIARFNLMFQSPRGKYQIDMYPTYMKLASKTFQYKIFYKFVQKMFLFQNEKTSQNFFVIGLNPPIRQGRTPHQYLLVAFGRDEELDEKFNIDAQTCKEKYQDIMQPEMSGKAYDVVTRVFKALTDRKVLVPGAAFQSKYGDSCIRCNWKANDGFLYAMEKSFFFLKKPLMHIRHVDITELSFERLSNSSTGSRTFDLRIVTNEEKNNEYVFSGIARDEYQGLFDFLKNKKLNITSQFEGAMTTGASGRQRVATNYDEEHDPHLNRIHDEQQAEGSDSEEDSDFEGAESSSSSSSEGSDVNPEVSESDDDAPKKKSKKKRAAASDDDDDDEGGARKKGTKRKRKGDSDEPKQKTASSAYFRFLEAERPKLAAEQPDLPKGQPTMLALAARWQALSAEERAPYQAAYEAEKAELLALYGPPKRATKSKSKKSADGKPKAPPSAQTLWSQERRPQLKEENPDLTSTEVTKKLAEEWKALDENSKQTYVEQNLAAKKKYKAELAAWEKEHPDGGKKGSDDAMEDVGGEADAEDEGETAEEKAARKAARKAKKEAKKSKKEKKEKKKDKEGKSKKKDKKNKNNDEGGDEDMADDTEVKPEPMEE